MMFLNRRCVRPLLNVKVLEKVSVMFMSKKSNKTSLYSILEVDPKANQKEIKDAYLKLSKLWHPDMHRNSDKVSEETAEFKFREVSDAYQTLSDPHKRQAYDVKIGLAGTLGESQSKQTNYEPWRPSTWRPGHGTPGYGVDRAFGRRIEFDLSEERMQKAWEAYKIRWENEQEERMILEEKKLKFRIELDRKREMFDYLTEEEKNNLRESIGLFRNPFNHEKPLGETFYNSTDNNPYIRQDSVRGKRNSESRQTENGESFGSTSEKSTFTSGGEETEQQLKEIVERLKQKFNNSSTVEQSLKKDSISSKVEQNHHHSSNKDQNSPKSSEQTVGENSQNCDSSVNKSGTKSSNFEQSVRKSKNVEQNSREEVDEILKSMGSNSNRDPLFEEMIKDSKVDKEEKKSEPEDEMFKFKDAGFSYRADQDPLQFTKAGVSDLFSEIRKNHETLRQKWNESEFLSDASPNGPNAGRRTAFVVSRGLLAGLFTVMGLVFFHELSNPFDPTQEDEFLKQLREKERLEKENKQTEKQEKSVTN